MASKIDIDRFICSLMSRTSLSLFYKMEESLEDQGLEYKDGEIVEIDNPQTIKFNESEDIDSVWPKEVVNELLEETQKNTPKVKEELKKYFSNVFPTIYDIDVDKMVEEYKERIIISQSLKYDDLLVRAIAYKQGLKDMLKVIKEGDKDETTER